VNRRSLAVPVRELATRSRTVNETDTACTVDFEPTVVCCCLDRPLIIELNKVSSSGPFVIGCCSSIVSLATGC